MNGLIPFGKHAVIQILSLSPYLSPKDLGHPTVRVLQIWWPWGSEGPSYVRVSAGPSADFCVLTGFSAGWLALSSTWITTLCPLRCAGLVLWDSENLHEYSMLKTVVWAIFHWPWGPSSAVSLSWIPLGTSLRHKELPDPLHGWGIRGLDSCPAQGCLSILCRLRCVVWLSVGLFLMLRLSSSCVQGNGPRGAVFLNSSKPIWRLWPSASRFHPGKREFASIHDSLLDPSLSFPPSTGKKEWTSPFSLWQRFPWLHIWLPWFLLKRYGL